MSNIIIDLDKGEVYYDSSQIEENRIERISEAVRVILEETDQERNFVIDIEDVEEIQCGVCKAKLMPNVELHYIAKSISNGLFSSQHPVKYDAYDCPLCGCQIILGQRFEKDE